MLKRFLAALRLLHMRIFDQEKYTLWEAAANIGLDASAEQRDAWRSKNEVMARFIELIEQVEQETQLDSN